MAIVSLSEAAKLTGKSKSIIDKDVKNGKFKTAKKNSKGVWEIDTDELFALYPEQEQQKCERLESELNNYKSKVLSLENEIVELKNELANEASKRQGLENAHNKYVKIDYGDGIRGRETKQYQENQIQLLLNFIANNNSFHNTDVLLMFKRVLGGFVPQLNKHFKELNHYEKELERYTEMSGKYLEDFHEKHKRPEFEYKIRSQYFYDYMLTGYGNYQIENGDHISEDHYLRRYFSEIIYESDLN